MAELLHDGMHIHFIGIGGFGVSAIARVIHEMGYTVSGCDMSDSSVLAESLRELGIPIEIGHDPAHLDTYAPDALVVSAAIPTDNAEIQAAQDRGIPIYRRAEIVGALMEGKIGIAVAGTHGKTTTTAMIAHTLDILGYDPTFIIGGVATNFGTNARAGSSDIIVVEADEYDGMFLGLRPQIIVLTSLELDHPDLYSDMDSLRGLFGEFLALLPEDGTLIIHETDQEVKELAGHLERSVKSYGLDSAGEWTVITALANPNDIGGTNFRVFHNLAVTDTTGISRSYNASLQVPGDHSILNALAALSVATELGSEAKDALAALATFTGVGRRFEVVGEVGGVTIIDDYAHHPTAIRATLQAARSRYPENRIWAVWQPHTFSRTAILLNGFAASFDRADHVVITDIFRSRDQEDYGVSSQSVLDLMDHPSATHVGGDLNSVADTLAGQVQEGDVVIVMSAGDGPQISARLLDMLG